MNDKELSRKVAEIEGWHPNANSDHLHACWWFRGDERHGGGPPPYARDWAWCGPLVEKHWVQLWPMPGEADTMEWGAQSAAHVPQVIADTPQRAICLAVIAAHEGKG